MDDSVSLPENEAPLKKRTLKTTITERKLELLKRCVESMAPGSSAKQPTHFALLVEEKLGRLSQKNRMIAEKRIVDILVEIEINEFEGGLHQVVQTNQLPAIQINELPNQPALHINQHISSQLNANLPYPSRNSISSFSHGPNVFFRLNKKIVNICCIEILYFLLQTMSYFKH